MTIANQITVDKMSHDIRLMLDLMMKAKEDLDIVDNMMIEMSHLIDEIELVGED